MSKKTFEDKVTSVVIPADQPVFKPAPVLRQAQDPMTASEPVELPQPLAGLTEGRMCHYVLPDGRNKGEHRPAIVVKVWSTTVGTSNLQVFTDGSNDGADVGTRWVTSVVYSEDKTPGTWHWIEKA
jgi:hypothetical protein